MNARTSIKVKGKRFSFGLVVLSIILTLLLSSLFTRLLRDIARFPESPNRHAINEAYRSQLQDGAELWDQAQPGIESRIDEEQRAALLQDSVPLAYDGDFFYLGIPDRERLDSVRRRLSKHLRDSLTESAGKGLALGLSEYRGWTWIEPLETISTRLAQERDKAGRQLKDLQQKTRRMDEEVNTLKNTLDTLLRVFEAKTTAPGATTPGERAQVDDTRRALFAAQDTRREHLAAIEEAQTRLQEAKEQAEAMAQTIRDRDRRAETAYGDAMATYRTFVFVLRFLYVIPLILLAAYILAKLRRSRYIVIYSAYVAAASWTFWMFLDEYVPHLYLGYVVRGTGIAVLLILIVAVVRRFHRISKSRLAKQIRDALVSRRCPNCSFPLYEGQAQHEVLGLSGRWPLGGGGSRSVQVVKNASASRNFCPNCGLPIFDACKECGAEKHALLPHCPKCNAETDVIDTYQAYLDTSTEETVENETTDS